LKAMYSIKVGLSSNGQLYAAGMGIGVENTPSGMQSQVIFLADRFAVTHQAGAQVTLPFVIQNGQTFIRNTVIGEGTIDNTKIGSYIQSTTWDGTGNVGWHINKSGYAVFNNVTVRGTVYATNGEFTGKITATSGSFKGVVEAESFVGDVANMYVAADTDPGVKNVTRTITFTDSSTAARSKSISIDFVAKVLGSNSSGWVDFTIDIAGNSRRYRVSGADAGTSAVTYVPIKHTHAGVTARTVTATITVSINGMTGFSIYSPTMIVTRGSGAWSST
ncbi:DUF1983 domain-containing protein, partial [Enterobacter hormaechei]